MDDGQRRPKERQWFFGIWSDPDVALAKYLDEVDEIQAGRDLRKTGVVGSELTAGDMCSLFLERQERRIIIGEVSRRHFTDNLRSCRLLVDYLGKLTRAASLRAADFPAFKAAFPSTWGPEKAGNEIQRIRICFKGALESDLIPALPNFGPDFRKPSRTVRRRDQQQRQAERGGNVRPWCGLRIAIQHCS